MNYYKYRKQVRSQYPFWAEDQIKEQFINLCFERRDNMRDTRLEGGSHVWHEYMSTDKDDLIIVDASGIEFWKDGDTGSLTWAELFEML